MHFFITSDCLHTHVSLLIYKRFSLWISVYVNLFVNTYVYGFCRWKSKWGCEQGRNQILQQPHQWTPSQRFEFTLIGTSVISSYIVPQIMIHNIIFFAATGFRSKTICDTLPLGSSPSFGRWVWWFLKPSHCVSTSEGYKIFNISSLLSETVYSSHDIIYVEHE